MNNPHSKETSYTSKPGTLHILKAAIKERDTPTTWFIILTMIAALFILTLPFSNWSQQNFMRAMHLKSARYDTWAVIQVLPSMYNFANRRFASENQIDWDSVEIGDKFPSEVQEVWVNHYPVRNVTWELRKFLSKRGRNTHFRFESRYQGTVIKTDYIIRPENGGLQMDIINE